MVRRICEITVTLDFIFRLVLCSSENVSFNCICLNVLEGIRQFYLLVWFKKTRLQTPFNGDNVKALVITSNVKTWSFISLRKFRKLQHFLCFFGFQWPNNRLKMVSTSPNDQKYQRYPLVLKLNVTLARPLRLVILYFFKRKLLSDDRRLYLHDSKWNSRSDVDGLNNTKQLLNLLCIVYFTDQKNSAPTPSLKKYIHEYICLVWIWFFTRLSTIFQLYQDALGLPM